MISIIVNSRVQGNPNHNLKELVRSLQEHSRHPEKLQLLVKFDDDDMLAMEAHDEIMNYPFAGLIKTASGPRGRGYIDIHHGYNQLLPMISKETNIVIAMADDFRAERDWDNALRNATAGAGDYFIIHQRPHPIPKTQFVRPGFDKEARENFDMSNNMFNGEDLYIIDEAPAWSPALLKACVWDYGNMTFPVSFTDAWTLCLEYVLWQNYKINITNFLPNVFINRKTCELDQPTNARWNTDRKINFEYIASSQFQEIVSHQAKEIACHLSATAKA